VHKPYHHPVSTARSWGVTGKSPERPTQILLCLLCWSQRPERSLIRRPQRDARNARSRNAAPQLPPPLTRVAPKALSFRPVRPRPAYSFGASRRRCVFAHDCLGAICGDESASQHTPSAHPSHLHRLGAEPTRLLGSSRREPPATPHGGSATTQIGSTSTRVGIGHRA